MTEIYDCRHDMHLHREKILEAKEIVSLLIISRKKSWWSWGKNIVISNVSVKDLAKLEKAENDLRKWRKRSTRMKNRGGGGQCRKMKRMEKGKRIKTRRGETNV